MIAFKLYMTQGVTDVVFSDWESNRQEQNYVKVTYTDSTGAKVIEYFDYVNVDSSGYTTDSEFRGVTGIHVLEKEWIKDETYTEGWPWNETTVTKPVFKD